MFLLHVTLCVAAPPSPIPVPPGSCKCLYGVARCCLPVAQHRPPGRRAAEVKPRSLACILATILPGLLHHRIEEPFNQRKGDAQLTVGEAGGGAWVPSPSAAPIAGGLLPLQPRAPLRPSFQPASLELPARPRPPRPACGSIWHCRCCMLLTAHPPGPADTPSVAATPPLSCVPSLFSHTPSSA